MQEKKYNKEYVRKLHELARKEFIAMNWMKNQGYEIDDSLQWSRPQDTITLKEAINILFPH